MKENKQQQSKSPKKKEQLSTKELKELMGMNQPTYKRVHGAMRRK
jgi:hypothetical protein